MRYKIIYTNTEEELESEVNAFITDVKKDTNKDIVFIGAPFQVQHGPESFKVAQAMQF